MATSLAVNDQVLFRALNALTEFAERNFPANERYKSVLLFMEGVGGNRWFVAGGINHNTKNLPGVYCWKAHGHVGDARVASVQQLKALRQNPEDLEGFLQSAYRIVDFEL